MLCRNNLNFLTFNETKIYSKQWSCIFECSGRVIFKSKREVWLTGKGSVNNNKKKEQHKPKGDSEEEDSKSISCVTVDTESSNTEWMATSYEVQENYKIKVMGK